MIPFYDCLAEDRSYRQDIERAIGEVLDSGWYILGPQLAEFEAEFAARCGTRHAIGVGCGLDALALILAAYKLQRGWGPDDEVIVPAHGFIATALAVNRAGLKLTFCDIDPATFNLSPETLGSALTPKTRAIIAVHLYGRACDTAPLRDIADAHGAVLIEDAAQAFGATLRGTPVGHLGDAAAFSFYPTKNLGGMGDGGAAVTDDAELARLVRSLRNYGGTTKYRHELQGANSRLDEIQAAILRVKLRRTAQAVQRRREIAGHYAAGLAGSGLILPEIPRDGTGHAWHLYVARAEDRETFIGRMQENGVGCGIHYPLPIHHQEAYRDHAELSLPHAELAARQVVSLPMGAALEDADLERIVCVATHRPGSSIGTPQPGTATEVAAQ